MNFFRDLWDKFGVNPLPQEPARMRDDFDQLYDDFHARFLTLRQELLDDLQGGAYSVDAHAIRVSAFCVLFYSALESYFEDVAKGLMEKSIAAWLKPKRKISRPLIHLIAFANVKPKNEFKDGYNLSKVMRGIVNESKSSFSKVLLNNHGASREHLLKLMSSVGVEVTQDPTLLSSLQLLSSQRGNSAHKFSFTSTLNPNDALRYALDCLAIAEDLREKAKVALRG